MGFERWVAFCEWRCIQLHVSITGFMIVILKGAPRDNDLFLHRTSRLESR